MSLVFALFFFMYTTQQWKKSKRSLGHHYHSLSPYGFLYQHLLKPMRPYPVMVPIFTISCFPEHLTYKQFSWTRSLAAEYSTYSSISKQVSSIPILSLATIACSYTISCCPWGEDILLTASLLPIRCRLY